MGKKVSIVFVSLTIILAIFLISHNTPFKSYKKTSIFIGDSSFMAYLADTPVLRERGLSGTTGLPNNSGMLFVFDQPDKYAFWMKDMNYPLDFIWIGGSDGQYVVSDITENVLPESYPKTYSPKEPISIVFEVKSGTISAEKIQIGDTVKLHF